LHEKGEEQTEKVRLIGDKRPGFPQGEDLRQSCPADGLHLLGLQPQHGEIRGAADKVKIVEALREIHGQGRADAG
jgi:hypothetical protein